MGFSCICYVSVLCIIRWTWTPDPDSKIITKAPEAIRNTCPLQGHQLLVRACPGTLLDRRGAHHLLISSTSLCATVSSYLSPAPEFIVDKWTVNRSFCCAEHLLLSFPLGMRLIPARCIFVCVALH